MNFVPDATSFNVDTVAQIEPDDTILASFVNAYYQNFINNAAYNKRINDRQNTVATCTLRANQWSGSSAPYTQTAAVTGITYASGDKPTLVSKLADGASAATQKAYNKAFGIISQGTGSVNGTSATFKVYKIPATDITVGLKGV